MRHFNWFTWDNMRMVCYQSGPEGWGKILVLVDQLAVNALIIRLQQKYKRAY